MLWWKMCMSNMYLWYDLILIKVNITVLLKMSSLLERLPIIMTIKLIISHPKDINLADMKFNKDIMILMYWKLHIIMIMKLIKFSPNRMLLDTNIHKKRLLFMVNQSTKKVTFLYRLIHKDQQLVLILIIEIKQNLMALQRIKWNLALKKLKRCHIHLWSMKEDKFHSRDKQSTILNISHIKFKLVNRWQLFILKLIKAEKINLWVRVDINK